MVHTARMVRDAQVVTTCGATALVGGQRSAALNVLVVKFVNLPSATLELKGRVVPLTLPLCLSLSLSFLPSALTSSPSRGTNRQTDKQAQ